MLLNNAVDQRRPDAMGAGAGTWIVMSSGAAEA
jgi:hypothetical protein